MSKQDSWLDKYPDEPKNQNVKKILIFGVLILAGVLLLYELTQYLLLQASQKLHPMVVKTTGIAGSGLTMSLLATKFLPFLLAFKAIMKIIKTILTIFFLLAVVLLYLNFQDPQLIQSLFQQFS